MSDEDDDDLDGVGGEAWLPSSLVLQHAIELTQEYRDDGVTLGVRGLYYQFVGRGIVSPEELASENGKGAKRFYKRLGRICAEARYNGDLDIDALADEGRDVHEGDYTREDVDVDAAHKTAGSWIRTMHRTIMATARWSRQPKFVSVWVEKQGLTSAVKPVCDQHGVSFFACKGYPSVSALWDWLQQADFACNGDERDDGYRFGDMHYSERHVGGTAEEAVILYFGDHDPDGFEIPRSSERALRRLMETYDRDIPLRFKRVALSLDQAEQYRLPPFEAKMTSARYAGYRAEHGTDRAWEIDALDLRVLRDLVKTEIEKLWVPSIGARQRDAARGRERELKERIADPIWLRDLFDNDDG